MIKHFVPSSLIEAFDILATHDCYIMAGGTDLMLQKHRSSGLLPNFDKDVLYIANLGELNYIDKCDDHISIGASTKYVDILKSDLVPALLKEVILDIASPNIRNMATLVGNVANASPAGDAIVPLYLFDAYVVLGKKDGIRKVLVKDFIKGVRKIDRQPDELIIAIEIPLIDLETKWVKVGSRAAESISKISFAGAYKLDKGIISDFRIAFGSVATTVKRDREIENKYIGLSLDEFKNRIDEIVKDYGNLISPIDDHRSTKDYRHKVAMNLLKDFIRNMK